MHFAKRTFHQCADHESDHLVKESVAVELDRDTRTFLADAYGINCTDGGPFGFSAIGGEAAKLWVPTNVSPTISLPLNLSAVRYARHGDTRTEAELARSRFCSDKFFLLPKDARENPSTHIDSEEREWRKAVTH